METNIASLVKLDLAIGACAYKCDPETRKWVIGIFVASVLCLVFYEKHNEKKRDELVAKSLLSPSKLY